MKFSGETYEPSSRTMSPVSAVVLVVTVDFAIQFAVKVKLSVTLKLSATGIEGMGFAIPMATAEPILEDLMNQKEIAEKDQAYLGITGRDVTSEYAKAYGFPEGIYVSEVSENSPAERAGLKTGYIITELNGKTVKTLEQLQERLSRCEAGEKGTLTVQVASGGEYQEKTLEVTFGKKQE